MNRFVDTGDGLSSCTKFLLALALTLGLGLATLPQAAQAKNLALVIGNADYARGGALTNTINDARAMAAFLEGEGFAATLVTDATAEGMTEALTSFAGTLTRDDVAVFYYAGHGLQMNGQNFLVGIEATLADEDRARAETLRLGQVIETIEARANAAIVFIDACRNNPIAYNLATRSEVVELGLAPFEVAGQGSLVSFAAGPGQVAYDGTSGNSPFTSALLERLGTPGLEASAALKQVILDVRAATGNRQTPQFVSSLGTDFYFGGEPVPAAIVSVGALPAINVAKVDYDKAVRVSTARVWQLFLEKHPGTYHAEVGQAALRTLLRDHPGEAIAATQMSEDSLGLDRETRAAVQLALSALGYEVGAVDGVLGPNSRREIAAYQKTRSLPSTGFITDATLEALGVDFVPLNLGTIASSRARRYSAGDLAGLETDERLLFAIECLGRVNLNYGFFRGHIYIAVQTSSWFPSATARRNAERCGGQLVSIGSEAENDFVFSLIARDPGYFNFDPQPDGSYSLKGPIIGLKQEIAAKDPRAGWYWLTGEPLTYTDWESGQPADDYWPMEETGVFGTSVASDPRTRTPYVLDDADWHDTSESGRGYIIEFD